METQHPSNPFAESGLFQSSADVWRPLKVAADGGPGDGKTFAITEIARGIWEAEGKKGIVVLQDTEGSTKDIIPYFEQVGLIEDVNFFSSVSRSLLDYEKILRMCIERRAIFMIDSVTHIAEAYQDAFSREKGRPIIYPQDALILKPEWKRRFSKPLVDAECHVLFTGRAAWEYRMEINEQTGKKEFNPTKLKMRGDPELLYEPDVVLFAEQTQAINEDGDLKPSHWLTVLKDRTRQMQGAQFKFDPTVKWSPDKNPIWESVKPIFDFYSRGKNKTRMPAPAETSMASLFQKGNAEALLRTASPGGRAHGGNRRRLCAVDPRQRREGKTAALDHLEPGVQHPVEIGSGRAYSRRAQAWARPGRDAVDLRGEKSRSPGEAAQRRRV